VNKFAINTNTSEIGLCLDCEYARHVEAKENSVYFLCERSLTDPTFPKYPRLPVRQCLGYVKDSRGTFATDPPRRLKLITGAPVSWQFGESQLIRLKTQLASVEFVFGDANPKRIDRRPAPGKWSARENLAHIGRYHEIFLERLHRIVTEPSPRFARYRAEEDPGWQEWASRPVQEVRTRLAALRLNLVDKIVGLQPREYARVGIHSSFGEMTLSLWLEFFLVHEAHHLYVILQRLRER